MKYQGKERRGEVKTGERERERLEEKKSSGLHQPVPHLSTYLY